MMRLDMTASMPSWSVVSTEPCLPCFVFSILFSYTDKTLYLFCSISQASKETKVTHMSLPNPFYRRTPNTR